MFWKSLAFEWRYYLRQPSFTVTALVFFLLPFLATATDSVRIGGGGNVLYNGSYAIIQTVLIMGIFALFLLVNFIAGTATRNHTTKMSELIYTRPVNPAQYQLGRFMGATLVSLTVFAAVPLGVLLGSLMPWVDPERIGPTQLSFYLTPFFYVIVPGFLSLGMIFYALAQQVRSMMAAYLTALGIFIVYIVGGVITSEPQYRDMAALLDPFALRTFGEISRYWTVFDKNVTTLTLDGVLLQNRLIWLAIGGAILLAFGGIFSFKWQQGSKKVKPTKASRVPAPVGNRINFKASGGYQWHKFVTNLGFEMRQVLLSPAMIVLVIFSIFNLTSLYAVAYGGIYGTDNWPLTQNMTTAIVDNFSLTLMIVVIYYSGEIVWRERGSGMGDIIESTPVFNAVFWVSKLFSMWAVLAVLYFIGMLFTLFFQLTKGYTNFEFGLYICELFYVELLPWMWVTVLAFFIQVLSPNKYMGMLITSAYLISTLVLNQLGVEHNMWTFGSAPQVLYSDLNGYGWFLTGFNWYMLYWGSLSMALSVIGYGLWQRGPESKLKDRLRLLGYQMGKTGKGILAVSLVVFLATGGFIHYNTKVLNEFTGRDEGFDLQAEYERQFVQYEDANIPVVTKVNAKVDIFPEQRRISAIAEVVIKNKRDTPITRVLVSIPRSTPEWQIDFPGARVVEIMEEFNSAWLEFDTPMMPGDELAGSVTVERYHTGFRDRDFDLMVAENGTFINNYELFPIFGFRGDLLISDRHERRKRDLPERPRAHKLEDTTKYSQNFFGAGIDFIEFEATLSTSPDQIAIAPGYLQKEWTENDRRYFHYKMDSPMVAFYSVLSARHEVKRDEHNGVNIEVYYDPKHAWNVDVMIQSVKDSLDYFAAEFGPYQHKQMRIIEFPGYRSFAQSFANTVPYSEVIGFTADLRDPEDIDYVYYVTAHEVAHQWWGHQLGAADVQGSQILSESLSQYSAIMVLRKRYGENMIRKFLTYELDRYLQGRSSELLEEMPFMRSENQLYIHYRKGSVVMMSILDRLGEERLNAALEQLMSDFRYKSDPYPTTLDLQAALNAQATPEEQAFIADIFEQITLYDLKVDAAEAKPLDAGYEVTLTISGAKYVADGEGMETEQPLEEWVDVGLFNSDPAKLNDESQVLYKAKHKIVSGTNTIVVTVDELPRFAGVDPFVKLIDRDSGDNVKQL
ncbi:ABC transporter permease/M1 family aminopeptidase [Alteromonas lipolytica]|uniref:Peptidase M1 membrane alanine aminopeptidase domain-containing protein n=1 Tax=Alteromonas lipolytica TaxID=1856405 RepID=A0A1E8F9V2_9ALTE|nr:M1 family aminopeptidase [Alteromonas lipolytica]OFI32398.1 hypothetical protein BFC17_06690 [Alteromonas lipolytica]GGF80083.1 membrane protein [Alteromonas lipolytica]